MADNDSRSDFDDDLPGFEVISLDDDWAEHRSRDLETAGVAPTIAEVMDLALLDRLLGVQEAAALAVADAEKAEADLLELGEVVAELRTEAAASRRELESLRDQLEAEHLSLARAEAKGVELENRLRREAELARQERAAASSANVSSLRREREAALATAAMGWWSRRRYRRLLSSDPVG